MQKILTIKPDSIFPQTVFIKGKKYFIIKQEDAYSLLDSICPHQGGVVGIEQGEFVCPIHHWRYDKSGVCTTVKRKKLDAYPLVEKDKALYFNDDITSYKKIHTQSFNKNISNDISIKLHAHACCEIKLDGFSILMDPWLTGLAFMGSWMHYPPTKIDIKAIKPNVIVITHEHSDHFHIESLLHFDKQIAIYFPDFPNERIANILTKAGFTNLIPMKFGNTLKIVKNIEITAYEPLSLWNDAIVHLNINGFNVLNYNDTGINHRIKKYLPEKIDLLMGQFSPGASGYPITWKNVNDKDKLAYYENAKTGIVKLILNAMDLYQAQAFLPFASFFMLSAPSHQSYRARLGINTLLDIKRALKQHNKTVIALMPGEQYSYQNGYDKKYTDSQIAALYQPETIESNVRNYFNQTTFEQFHSPTSTIIYQRVVDYFMTLNVVPELFNCEDIEVNFFISEDYNNKIVYSFLLQIKHHQLTIEKDIKNNNDLDFVVPINVIAQIVQNDLSWDEAHIGYWCEFNRKTKHYEADFWRLLQSPYYKKQTHSKDFKLVNKKNSSVSLTTPLESVLANTHNAEKILARYGLYCYTCGKAYQETLGDALLFHGITDGNKNLLIGELNALGNL